MTLELMERLEDSGHRSTETRRRICELLSVHQEGITAEDLVAEAKGIGRATVYRTLDLLVQERLLCKVSSDGASRYTLARASHHHHAICVSCGNVREFRDPSLEKALRHLSFAGEEVLGHQVEVQVLCGGCRQRPDRRRLADRVAPGH